MVARVVVTAHELSDRAIRVRSAGDETFLTAGMTREFEVGGDFSMEATDAPAGAPPAPAGALPGTTGDIFKDGDTSQPQHTNPNGIVRAEISAKLPKASGELMDVRDENTGVMIQRAVVPEDTTAGRSTQGGGPEAEMQDGALRTPGPQPAGVLATPGAVAGDATGDTNAAGAPTSRDPGTAERAATGQKEGANTAATTQTPGGEGSSTQPTKAAAKAAAKSPAAKKSARK